jgi:hypothetical protein
MDHRAIHAGRRHLGQSVGGRVGRDLAMVPAHRAVLPAVDLRVDDQHGRPLPGLSLPQRGAPHCAQSSMAFAAFHLLHIDGDKLMREPWSARRKRLHNLAWMRSHHDGVASHRPV